MTARKKINLLIIGLCCLFALGVTFIIRPLFLDIKKYSGELVSQKESLINLESKINRLQELNLIYKDVDKTQKEIDVLFVDAEVPVDFISFLEDLSDKYAIKTNISPSPLKLGSKDQWSYFIFQLSSSGSFNNLLKFLKRLENGPYLIEIQNLNIANGTQANFSIKVFAK